MRIVAFRVAPTFLVIFAALYMMTGMASAAPISTSPGVIATFEGKQINLREGWGAATSCVVFPKQRVECFRTNAQANAAIGQSAPMNVSAEVAFDCAFGYICLFGATNGVGRRLLFSDEYWHHLADYGFAGGPKSWRNNQLSCGDFALLGDGIGGSLNLEGCARSANLGQYWSYNAVDVFG